MPRPDHNGQSHEHRAELMRQCGLHQPDSCEFDWDAVERGAFGVSAAQETAIELFAAMLRCMVVDIEAAGANASYEATCHRIAIGIRQDDDESMRQVAVRRGVSVEAVSKRVKAIRDKHRIPLNSFNKPAAVAEGYRDSNRTRRKL